MLFFMLRPWDPELYNHLESQNFQAELCLVRWYRVLFAREYESNLLTCWDYFLSGPERSSTRTKIRLPNIDYFAAACLVLHRN